MGKTIFYRLFRFGSIPKKLRKNFEQEGIIISDEGFWGWYVTKRLKAPGRRAFYRKEGFIGFFVVTQKRLVCYSFRKRLINIETDDEKIVLLRSNQSSPNKLILSFDSADFLDGWEGEIELHLHTDKAGVIHQTLLENGVKSVNEEG